MYIDEMEGNISTKFQGQTIFNKKIKKITKRVVEGQKYSTIHYFIFFSIIMILFFYIF
jgi:hypothetical protein